MKLPEAMTSNGKENISLRFNKVNMFHGKRFMNIQYIPFSGKITLLSHNIWLKLVFFGFFKTVLSDA